MRGVAAQCWTTELVKADLGVLMGLIAGEELMLQYALSLKRFVSDVDELVQEEVRSELEPRSQQKTALDVISASIVSTSNNVAI